MSDNGAANGSSAGGSEPESPRPTTSIDDGDLPIHSPTENYLEKEENHELFAVGECSCDVEVAVETHCVKMKEEIKENDKKLDE